MGASASRIARPLTALALICLVSLAGTVTPPPSKAQLSGCRFFVPFWEGGEVDTTPDELVPGGLFSLEWGDANPQQTAQKEAFRNESWPVKANEIVLFQGPPPQVGSYRWPALVFPAGLSADTANISISHGEATKVVECPVPVRSAEPPPPTTTVRPPLPAEPIECKALGIGLDGWPWILIGGFLVSLVLGIVLAQTSLLGWWAEDEDKDKEGDCNKKCPCKGENAPRPCRTHTGAHCPRPVCTNKCTGRCKEPAGHDSPPTPTPHSCTHGHPF